MSTATRAEGRLADIGPFDWPGSEELVRIIKFADPNVLRMALYQLSGNDDLLEMKVERQALRGGVFIKAVLAPEHHAEVERQALALLSRGGPANIIPPGDEELKRLIEAYEGRTLSPEDLDLGVEELAFKDFPRDVHWSDRPDERLLQSYHVVIVGAGFSGVVAALQLSQLGIPYTIIERQANLGGVWETNRYPEARVDISSFLYQYKFEKNYPWKNFFATRDENIQYITHVARKHGIYDKIEFNKEVVSARWNDETSNWDLEIAGAGGTECRSTRIVISASGLFSTPRVPDIAGLDTFTGSMWHTTNWPDGTDLTGRRVALIGNGSTGAQMLKHIAEEAASVDVYQRTPQWIAPAENYKKQIPDEIHWLMANVPGYWNWLCYAAHTETLPFQYFQYHDRQWQEAGGKVSEDNEKLRTVLTEYVKDQLEGDERLIAACIPPYAPLARRLVIDNGFYKALTRENVSLITTGIKEICPTGVLDLDGQLHEADVIILAAGFEISSFFYPIDYQGRNGKKLSEMWAKDGPRAHLGMTIPGFPNLFCMYGPNTQPRIGGLILWAEIWSRYIGQVIVTLIESRKRTVECKQASYDDYNAILDAELDRLIWSTEGKGGYHVRDHGRSVMHSPWAVQDYHAMIKVADPTQFEFGDK